MRLPLLAALLTLACAADPVLLPDSGPCSSACGPGTVCSGGACVAVDAGSDGGFVDLGVPEDRPAPVDLGASDVGGDVGAMDAQQVVDGGNDAGVADAGGNRGSRYQACRVVGAPCADGSLCMMDVTRWDESTPPGICTSPCLRDNQCAALPADGGRLPPPRCVRGLNEVISPSHCVIVGCGGGDCPPSTICGPATFLPDNAVRQICVPRSDP